MDSSPIRIAFCITELDPGGAERALLELVIRLDRQVFEPAVFCLGPRGELAKELEQEGIPVTCFGATRSWHLGVIVRLIKALRRFRPVILQTWLFHANICGRFAGRLANVPIVVSGIRVAEKRSRWRLWAERVTQSLALAHVCVSQAVADFSIQQGGLNPDRVRVIPNGVDYNRFANAQSADRAKLGIPDGAKVLLFVGRLDPQKDPLWLWEAFPIIQEKFSDVHLVYVGEGELESQLVERIQTSESPNQVHLLGWRTDVPELLKAADILVLPSRWEGMPNVVLEASAAGTPVVATNVEGIDEILTDQVTGCIIRSRKTDELAQAIVGILEASDLRIAMGKSAQAIVAEKFTWEETSRLYQQFYQEVSRDLRRD